MAIFYALCCLACSALNDFVFKLFARRRRSRGIFAGLIGVVWFAAVCFLPLKWDHWQATLFWGSLSGFFSIVANLLLIEAMGMQSAGICSTVYRLNLVPVVLGAWLLLGETISPVHWVGIVAAVTAIFCFMPVREQHRRRIARFARLGLGLVIAAAFLRAGMGIAYKYAFLNGADRTGIMLVNAIFWIAGGVWYGFARERKLISFDRSTLVYGAVSGVGVLGIVFFMAAALQYGEAAIVLPIAQMSFPVTLLLSAVILHEPVTPRKLAGMGCSILAVILLCLNTD